MTVHFYINGHPGLVHQKPLTKAVMSKFRLFCENFTRARLSTITVQLTTNGVISKQTSRQKQNMEHRTMKHTAHHHHKKGKQKRKTQQEHTEPTDTKRKKQHQEQTIRITQNKNAKTTNTSYEKIQSKNKQNKN